MTISHTVSEVGHYSLWPSRANYGQYKSIMEDGHKFPDTFNEWELIARSGEAVRNLGCRYDQYDINDISCIQIQIGRFGRIGRIISTTSAAIARRRPTPGGLRLGDRLGKRMSLNVSGLAVSRLFIGCRSELRCRSCADPYYFER
jgi:hypothetical protein